MKLMEHVVRKGTTEMNTERNTKVYGKERFGRHTGK
jgi:hypothetical protein